MKGCCFFLSKTDRFLFLFSYSVLMKPLLHSLSFQHCILPTALPIAQVRINNEHSHKFTDDVRQSCDAQHEP